MITNNISKIRDILDKNKICPFCKSNLSLSADLALSKSHSGFFVKGNEIIFDINPKYFNHAKINIEEQTFDIEISNQIHPQSLFINYKSVNFQRTCHFCINNFCLKYSRFKFDNNQINSVRLESISFKVFINGEPNKLFNISSNYILEETTLKKLSFQDDVLYQIENNIFLPLVDFNFSSIDDIYDKIESIVLFY